MAETFAVDPLQFPSIVFAADCCRIVSGMVLAPATVPENVGLAIVGEVLRTTLPAVPVMVYSPRTLPF